MPSVRRRRLGAFGETAAEVFLTRQGYTISTRNWRCPIGEIDLVAALDNQVIFVEVRTRYDTSLGSPEESITAIKQKRLIALAYTYLEIHSLGADTPWRIDVITVIVDRAGYVAHLNHIPNAIEQRS